MPVIFIRPSNVFMEREAYKMITKKALYVKRWQKNKKESNKEKKNLLIAFHCESELFSSGVCTLVVLILCLKLNCVDSFSILKR